MEDFVRSHEEEQPLSETVVFALEGLFLLLALVGLFIFVRACAKIRFDPIKSAWKNR